MAIMFNEQTKTFFLDGKDMTYAFRVTESGYLAHLWCGCPIGHDDLSFHNARGRISFCPTSPGGITTSPRGYYTFHPEISFFGTSDYREPSVQIQTADGDRLCDLVYASHEILDTKPAISGMPSMRGGETLVVHLKDLYSDFGADLYYTVYDDASVVARRVVYVNNTDRPIKLLRAYSFAFGLPGQEYDVMSLQGSWACERTPEVIPMHHGVVSIDSKRCTSSATLNPFIAVMSKGATETTGRVIGVNLIYSSSFVLKVEGVCLGDTVITGGINDFDFTWNLGAGESFETPEAVIAVSHEGIGGMSRAFHDAYRNHLVPKNNAFASRPIVINNWEATYFNFNTEKLKAIVDAVEGTGIDTLVLDDGWFGKRDNDKSGLGDWVVNETKLEGGLKAIIDHTHSKGMKFGLWFEPEMISEDSDIFRAHPDYAIGKPNRPRCYSRTQYMMDLTRAEVRDYIVNSVNKVLAENDIDYVKWDYNRNVTDAFSIELEPERQMEFAHRYVLGVYDLFERIVKANPSVFFEGCSGGGARFDGGVLAYFPQIWTSDDSDAEERTRIQYGTSIVYPLSAMSAHVSAVPNHQTGRITPMDTRADIAHLAATGYELDTTVFTDEDKAVVKAQIEEYKSYEELVLRGDVYRIDSPFKGNFFTQMIVSKDKSSAMLTIYRRLSEPNPELHRICLAGLDKDKTYTIEGLDITAKGSTLMNVGIVIKYKMMDFWSETYRITEVK